MTWTNFLAAWVGLDWIGMHTLLYLVLVIGFVYSVICVSLEGVFGCQWTVWEEEASWSDDLLGSQQVDGIQTYILKEPVRGSVDALQIACLSLSVFLCKDGYRMIHLT